MSRQKNNPITYSVFLGERIDVDSGNSLEKWFRRMQQLLRLYGRQWLGKKIALAELATQILPQCQLRCPGVRYFRFIPYDTLEPA